MDPPSVAISQVLRRLEHAALRLMFRLIVVFLMTVLAISLRWALCVGVP